jgi:hypothetical protein
MRVRVPNGYTELGYEGIRYTPDEAGAFEVPEVFGRDLIHSLGAVQERSPPDLEILAIKAEAHVAATKAVYEQALVNAKTARAVSDQARAKVRAIVENKARSTLSLPEK